MFAIRLHCHKDDVNTLPSDLPSLPRHPGDHPQREHLRGLSERAFRSHSSRETMRHQQHVQQLRQGEPGIRPVSFDHWRGVHWSANCLSASSRILWRRIAARSQRRTAENEPCSNVGDRPDAGVSPDEDVAGGAEERDRPGCA